MEQSSIESEDEFVQRHKKNQMILQQVKEIWKESDLSKDDGIMQILNDFKEEILDDLEDEYEPEYKAIQVQENINIDLVPMNEVQKALIYEDKYPFLKIRKRILIQLKKISMLAMQFTKHPIFEFLTLLVIIFNSIMLALDDPTTNNQTQFQDLMDIIFLAVYTFEAVLKIIAMGFVLNNNAYLRDLWNILDLTVIITAYIPYFVNNSGLQLSALRSLRVLRPLRTISSVKSLRSIMMTLFASFAELGNSLIILGFTYTIFAIAGLQLFSGYAKLRCFDENGIIQMSGYDTDEPYCNGSCPDNYICGKMIDNPINGLLSFDDFGLAFLQVFIITTLEGWTTIMQTIMTTFSQFSVFYFLLCVIIGAFFLVNLTLAIIKINFSKAESQEPIKPDQVSYNLKQMKRLGIYKFIRDTHIPSITRKHTMRMTKLRQSINNQNNINVNNANKQIDEPKRSSIKVNFQPLNIKDFSKPHQVKYNNNRILLQGIQGVRTEQPISKYQEINNPQVVMKTSVQSVNAPQIRKLSKIGTQFKQSQRKMSITHQEESPLDELDNLLKFAVRRQSVLRVDTKIMASPRIPTPSKETPQPVSSNSMLDESQSPGKPHQSNYLGVPKQQFNFLQDQKSFNENDVLSVTLSEIDSISDNELNQRFKEFEISFQIEKSDDKTANETEDRKPIQHIHQKKRKQDVPLTYELSKEDEKLKIRLFQTKLVPRVVYKDFYSESSKDILVSLEIKKQKRDQEIRNQRIQNMKFNMKYQFSNNSTRLSLSKTQQQQQSKSSLGSNDQKLKETTIKSRKIIPLTEIPSVQEITTPKLTVRKQQKRKTIVHKAITYEQYQQGFSNIQEIDSNFTEKLEQVETQQITFKTPNEIQFYTQVGFQSYHQIKNDDINLSNGNLVGQSSIEDVIIIRGSLQQRFNLILQGMNFSKSDYMIYMTKDMLKMLQFKLFLIVDSRYFNMCLNLAVFMNTVILCLDGLVNNSEDLNSFNLAFTILFTIEMGLKIIGYGIIQYIRDPMNIFDSIIVALSLVDIFFLSGSSVFKSVRIFRAFRVLRVTKLMRSLKFMNFLVQVLSNAFQSLMYIFLLLILFIYIFTLLGMSFFGGQLTNTPSRQSYDTFYESFLVVFQVLTLENWNSILYELLQQPVSWIITMIYLIAWIFIGSYVLLNLFLASLLDQFEAEYLREHNLENNNQEGEQIQQQQIQQTQTMNQTVVNMSVNQSLNPILAKQLLSRQDSLNKFIYFSEPGLCFYSLNIFSQNNPIRRLCYKIVKNSLFDQIILFAIFLSSLKLVIDTYLSNFLDWADWFFAIFFGVEFLFKIIAYGFVMEENAYLRESWNILDFIIVVCSFIDISVASIDLSFVKILRLLRTLRPLRLISQNKSMKLLVTTLINSISGIVNVGVVVILVFLMFAILGVNLEKGKMYYCDIGNDEQSYLHQIDCIKEGYEWKNRDMNFDNVFWAMLTLFIVSTQEGWPTQMYWFVDADESGPIKNNQMWFTSYFLIFLLIGSILLMNMFVGVILVNYKLAEDEMKDKNVSRDQEDWISIQKLIVDSNPNFALYYPPKNQYRAMIFKIISNKIFDFFIMFCIILNIAAMASNYEGSSVQYQYILETLNLVLSVIFIFESVLKIIGFGPRGYFRNNWNQFDFFVVLSSILDMILSFTDNKNNPILSAGPQLIRVFRVLRVTRLFRLVKSLHSLKKLIDTALFSLPALFNVSALMFLLYFIFSVLGVFLFSNLSDGYIINSENNFNDFHHALILLFRCTTGEDWYLLMYDIMNKAGYYYCSYFIIFVVIMQRIMLNLFVLIILDQYERFYFNSDNPLQRFQEFEDDFVDGWAPLASETKGQQIHQDLLIQLMLQIKAPMGYDLKEKINTAVNDWKTYNSDAEKSSQNLEKIKIMVTTEAKKTVAKTIMNMQIESDENQMLEYHYVLFAFMKNFQTDLFKEVTQAGLHKLIQKEEQTLNKIKKNRRSSQEVNPCVELLFHIMCFRAYKRYAVKLKERMNRQQNEFSQKSSDSSYLHKSSDIVQRDSISQSLESIQESKQQFCLPPDLTVYQSDVNIAIKDNSQNTKNRGSVQQLVEQKLENISEFNSEQSISFNKLNDVSN
ncbi:unnamed protein product [Paramecium primaurelia]|uniref:Ion transport domain-containing protein n=1 Tax=Paramecium primaurelia TaxID=5886 RepID=A0A8S1KQZ4_PARPR|nr:unnamed protein product [Paramecium primaurelia]